MRPIEVPASYVDGVPSDIGGSFRANVARLYAHLARDLANGSRTVPDFQHALVRHRLSDVIERAADTGTRQTVRH